MTTPHQPKPHTDGIPDDIMYAAKNLCLAISRTPMKDIKMVIARAIISERERCARIAEKWKGHPADLHFAGKQIASCIRSPSTTQSHIDGETDNV